MPNNNKPSRVSIGDTAEIDIRQSSTAQGKRSTSGAARSKTPAAQPVRGGSVPANRPKKKRKKKGTEEKAKVFLFVSLLIISVFVALVCIGTSDITTYNDDTPTTSATPTAPSTTLNSLPDDKPVQGNVTVPEASTTETTAAEQPSFFNPATVTDCSFDTVVVNRNYRIPATYEDDVELVYVCGSGQRLQKEVAEQYELMFEAGIKDGVTLTPCSGYRSYETQTQLYKNKVNIFLNQGYSEEAAKIEAATIVMVPGSSEHNLGYAMDIVCVEEWFEDTEEFAWLMENAEDYGFILRYPKDKQDITKVIYEPWHWRYVGVEAAKRINASGMVLEEYYGKSAQ